MNLTVDQGNSYTKIGVFDHEDFIEDFVIPDKEVYSFLISLFSKHTVKNSILSSVIHTAPEITYFLQSESKMFIELNENTPLPIKNLYKTPSTLGKDRIAVAVGANYMKPNTDCLIIDAGTTITYEFVNANAEYLGGNISPGMKMRFDTLHAYTKRLPLVEPAEKVELLGNDTQSAIQSGVINGISFEMDGYIDVLKRKYTDLTIFLTGGDTFFFESTLKNRTFAVKNLLLIGLNRILNYNA